MQKFTKSFGSNNRFIATTPFVQWIIGGCGNPERDVNLVECEGCKKWFHPSYKK